MITNSHPEWSLPFVVDGRDTDIKVHDLIGSERTCIRDILIDRGAVLLRGFELDDVDGFDRIVRALSGAPLTYAERSSPRSTIKGQVYTSTDYPPTEEIFLHNENSYQSSWPLVLYFYCRQAPATQGATPLADVRQVYQRLDSAVREEFEERRWTVVRNFHGRFGLSWQYVFNTEDRGQVEEYCRGHGIQYEWRGRDALRTRAVRDAIHTHPKTGVPVWFNHVAFFHLSMVPADVREGLSELFDEPDLPANTYYGDGGQISGDVVAHIRDCYRAATTRFDWQKNDVLVVDNMLTAHGREPYTGPRQIGVAMAESSIG